MEKLSVLKLYLAELLERPWRLTALAVFFALIFPDGRLFIFGILTLALLYSLSKTVFREKRLPLPLAALVLIIGAGSILFMYGSWRLNYIKDYYSRHRSEIPAATEDGVYSGRGMGRRGPIEVLAKVQSGRVVEARLVSHRETVSIGGNALINLLMNLEGKGGLPVDAVTGATYTSVGFMDAVQDALWQGVPDAPHWDPAARFAVFAFSFMPYRVSINTLAIIFILILVFDYSLQAAFKEGTGPSLNCYNCQTCVGVCPVKMVDGEPFPMTMVLQARLGNYEKVARLARFCVGCSRCAGKCPIGNSPPAVASACVVARRQELEKAARLKPGVKTPPGTVEGA